MNTKAIIIALIPLTLPAQQEWLTPERAVAIAATRGPLAGVASATRQVTTGRARGDAALPNPVAEWRRENLGSSLAPDIFATLQVPFDVTGRRAALRSAAGAAMARGRADSAATARQLEFEVLRAYWRAALAMELAAIADTERVSRAQTAAFDGQRLREGAIAEVVAMRARLEADRSGITAAATRAEALRSLADLARLLGTSADLLPPLVALTPPPLDGVTPADTSWDAVRSRRPDLAAFRHAEEEMTRRGAAEARGVLGDLNVVGGYKGTGGYTTGLVGVLMPLPVFNRNEGPRERARGEALLARAALQDAEWRARGDVLASARAWAAVIQAGREGAESLDDRATEIASIAEATYREGAASLLELLEAQRARADARAATARWITDAHLARLEYRRVTGLPLTTSTTARP